MTTHPPTTDTSQTPYQAGAYPYDSYHSWDGHGWQQPVLPRADPVTAIKPVVQQLERYDGFRRKLATEGGTLADVARITEVLREEIKIKGTYGTHTCSLADRGKLSEAVRSVGYGTLQLDVRQLDAQWPVYYLCRIRRSYWSEYSLIVEDLYRSPGHPFLDERFVKLMEHGHELYYLRLSPFRAAVADSSLLPEQTGELDIDDILYRVGRHVLQAAWHEDQRVGLAVARHFDAVRFGQAIELLYLCLSGEMCELRSAVDETVLPFFETAWPHPPIHAFLTRLCTLDGEALTAVPQTSLKLYTRLSRSFHAFLSCEANWGMRGEAVPLRNVVLANIDRLATVAVDLRDLPDIREAVQKLEHVAQAVVEAITGVHAGE